MTITTGSDKNAGVKDTDCFITLYGVDGKHTDKLLLGKHFERNGVDVVRVFIV